MIYGYESQWKGPESLTATITNIAHSFVTRLIAQREHSGKRPMIFVAHCFGGIVLIKVSITKKLLVNGVLTASRL
jgi:predicted alpha/beta hydrolase family esterase